MSTKDDAKVAAAVRRLRKRVPPIVERVLADLLPGRTASVEATTDTAGDPSGVLVAIPLDRFELRVAIALGFAWDEAVIEPRLRAQLAEALSQQARFAARLEAGRVMVAASLERNGGMAMLDMRMLPIRLFERFEWDFVRLAVRFETLDRHLEPTVEEIDADSARGITGGVRAAGAIHRRRVARKRRLATLGAVLDIDLDVEAAIERKGWSLPEVVAALRHGVGDPDRYHCAGLACLEGRILFADAVGRQVAGRPIKASEL